MLKGQIKLENGIKLLAQKEELIRAFYRIKEKKNEELAKAFSNVFYITAIISLAGLPLGCMTDRSSKS